MKYNNIEFFNFLFNYLTHSFNRKRIKLNIPKNKDEDIKNCEKLCNDVITEIDNLSSQIGGDYADFIIEYNKIRRPDIDNQIKIINLYILYIKILNYLNSLSDKNYKEYSKKMNKLIDNQPKLSNLLSPIQQKYEALQQAIQSQKEAQQQVQQLEQQVQKVQVKNEQKQTQQALQLAQQKQQLALQKVQQEQQALQQKVQEQLALQQKQLLTQPEQQVLSTGIENNDAECFVNSVLQLMCQLTDFNNELKKLHNQNDTVKKYINFLTEYENASKQKKKYITAENIKQLIFIKKPRTLYQEDAEEYLSFLLNDIFDFTDSYSTDIRKLIEIKYKNEFKTSEKNCDYNSKIKQKTDNKPTDNILKIEIREDLLINYTKIKQNNSEKLYFKQYLDTLNEDSIVKICETCKIQHNFLKKIDYNEFGKYLFIQIKRFRKDYENLDLHKLRTNVDNIMTEQIILNDNDYNLIGFIVHTTENVSPKDTLSNGHYMCYTKKNNGWKKYNDAKIEDIDNIYNIPSNEDKYIYLYERID